MILNVNYRNSGITDLLFKRRAEDLLFGGYCIIVLFGMHSLTARTSIGGSMRADFPVTVMPADSHQDNVTVKWVGNASPWVPPVTVTVTIPVPGPTRIVTVTITPDQNQLNATALAQQRIVAAEQTAQTTSLAITALAGIGVTAILFIGIRFVYRARKRKRWVVK